MGEALKKYLQGVVDSVEGLLKLFVSDREGIPVVVCARAQNSSDNYPRPNLLTSHSVMLEQCSKLGVGQQKSIVCLYKNYQLVVLHCPPLSVTLIASADANTGQLLALRGELEPAMKQIQAAVAEVLPRVD